MNRFLLFAALFALWGGCSQSDLTEKEQALAGSWRFAIDTDMDTTTTYGYLELGADRKGINGMVANNILTNLPPLTRAISNWKINNDTLIVTSVAAFNGQYRMTTPDHKTDTPLKNMEWTERWIVKMQTDDQFVGEVYDPAIPAPSRMRFTRTPKLELATPSR